MQHLTPVGLSQDGKELVLTSDTGEEFAVTVDHRFRTALRGDHARLGQLEMKMESALRPRDIQARIRAGESAEDVAAAAQTTVDAIMAFAAPVLAERAHVAQTAVKSSIRRATSESTPVGRTLDDASRVHFSTVSVRADDVDWDAWRREDGRWNLVAMYEAGGAVHLAEFTYDQPGRYVVADNDEARLLTGEAVASPQTEPPARRLSSVPSDPSRDELPLGDDALELVREHDADRARERAYDESTAAVEEPAAVSPPTFEPSTPPGSTTDLTETVAELRRAPAEVHEPAAATEQGSFDDLVADHADADWIDTVPAERAPRSTTEPADEPAEEPAPESPAEPAAEQPTPAEDAPPRKKGRSSVPSWDEIMFGGGKQE